MSYFTIVTDTAGQGGINPRRVKVVTSDNLSTITTAGYINRISPQSVLYGTDVLDIVFSYSTLTQSGTYGAFTVLLNGGIVTLGAATGSGDVLLPVVVGNAPVFSNTAGQIADSGNPPALMTSLPVVSGHAVVLNGTVGRLSDAGAAPILTTVPSILGGQLISMETTIAAPTINVLTSIADKTGPTTMTSGSLIGLWGEARCGSTIAGQVYGIKGKVTLTGTASGTARISAISAELDIDEVDIENAIVSLIRADFGGLAEIGVDSNLYGIMIDNTTPSIPNALMSMTGGGDVLFEMDDNNALVGPTYFVAAGTTAGSAGDVTKCNASKVLKIKVNNVDYWIPLFASNS